MTILISEVYDAFLSAGAPEDKARKAAETLAGYDSRLASIEQSLTVLKWQVGAMAVAMVGVGGPAVWMLVRIASKVGALS